MKVEILRREIKPRTHCKRLLNQRSTMNVAKKSKLMISAHVIAYIPVIEMFQKGDQV
jgi:hypothetical protein